MFREEAEAVYLEPVQAALPARHREAEELPQKGRQELPQGAEFPKELPQKGRQKKKLQELRRASRACKSPRVLPCE